jgi:hypothetical protein
MAGHSQSLPCCFRALCWVEVSNADFVVGALAAGHLRIHGTVVMLLLKFYKQSTPAFRALVHAADLMWPALIYAFATGRNVFFLFFVFVLAAAAYRWGLWETVGTQPK